MFKSLFSVAMDVTRIATAPIEIALDIVGTTTKPIAKAAKDSVDCVKKEVE